MYRMLYPLCIWSVLILLNVLKYTYVDAVIGRESKKNLHQHMTKREIEYYFGVKDPSEIPEYEVRAPHQTEANGRAVSRFRRRRSIGHPDVLHYKLHAFGSKLELRLKRNLNLMSPNLVIERHYRGGIVTTHPAPRNKYYLGKVSSDPDSLVALRSDKGLSGMIRTSSDLLFVQPLPGHLAKRVRRSADSAPHLIYRLSPGKAEAPGCETKISGDDRLKRSVRDRTTRDTSNSNVNYTFLEAALIVPKSYEEKYGSVKFQTILLVIANMVAGMYQDPSIGEIKVYYVVSKIIVLNSTEDQTDLSEKFVSRANTSQAGLLTQRFRENFLPLGRPISVNLLHFLPPCLSIHEHWQAGFSASDSNSRKLTKMLRWARPSIQLADSNPEHYDVFSYVSNKIPVGGLAPPNSMCGKSRSNGNVQADRGLQTALHIAHETGHNFKLAHDDKVGCNSNAFIMAAVLPGGIYAATWSNCSRNAIQEFLKNDARSWCLKDPPTAAQLPTLSPQDQGKLPGEIFSGDEQCVMQYGTGWRMSPYQQGVCGTLYCFKDGTQLSYVAPVADGSPCGVRSWCIGGKCGDNGRPRIHGKWSPWPSVYSSCTRNCGGGVQFRTRVCRNPVPSNGGDPCNGISREWRVCNPQACPEGSKTFRQEQCSQKNSPAPYYLKSSPCALWCRFGRTATGHGTVKDGTRCTLNESPINLDVCIQGRCQPVGCDHVLQSNSMIDRCGKCGGDGDTCFIVSSNYTTSHKVKGAEQADLIVILPVGAYSVQFLMRKSSNNYIGVQTDNGTHLVGGGRSSHVQTVIAANTTIQYTRTKAKYKDVLQIPGPTNAFLRVVYVYVKGENPGVDYDFIRPVKSSETPPERNFEWSLTDWTGCSATCGKGSRTRSARCIRSDDKTPASNRACGREPSTKEDCRIKDCPSAWQVTPWTDCSRSCGRGVQTRDVKCLMKIDADEYGTGTNCSADNKPNITSKVKYCNSIACDSDWDTEDGFVRGQCGEPLKPDELKCYHMDQFGDRARIPDILCRYREKPIRLPCTTLPPPTSPLEGKTDTTRKPTKSVKSQSIQAQSSMVVAFLIPVLQILQEYFIFP